MFTVWWSIQATEGNIGGVALKKKKLNSRISMKDKERPVFASSNTAYVFFPLTGARFDDGAGGDNEVQRTMLELINQLDGFDPRGNIKVLMATNRPDTLDPALMRPGRLDRKIEFGLPDLEVNKLRSWSPVEFSWCNGL